MTGAKAPSLQAEINAILGGYDSGMAPLLQLAVDGSWGPETPRVYSCGGLVAVRENWGVISRHWNLALESEGQIGRAHV